MDNFGIVAAQEQDDAGDILGLWPRGKIRFRHRFAVGLRVNDARQDGIDPYPDTSEIRSQ